MVNIEIDGIEEVKKYINKKSKQATKGMSLGLGQAAIYVQGEVKKSIAGAGPETKSVDTGRFLNSVGVDKFKDGAKVYSDLSYARILEDGGSKKSNRIARNHFKNSAARSKSKVKDILQRNINSAIKNI